MAVSKMKKGEIALITISPLYGFGATETKRDLALVPANSTLVYELELISFTRVKVQLLNNHFPHSADVLFRKDKA